MGEPGVSVAVWLPEAVMLAVISFDADSCDNDWVSDADMIDVKLDTVAGTLRDKEKLRESTKVRVPDTVDEISSLLL